jgi:heat shock protein HslJ
MKHGRVVVTIVVAFACQSGAKQDVDTAIVDSGTVSSASVVRPALLLNCGDHEVTLWYGGESTVAIIDGERLTLRRASHGAELRDVALSDSTTYVVRQDSVTTLHVKGQDPGPCLEQSAHPFEARGHEPGWVLRIVGGRITYIGNYGADTVESSNASVTTTGRTTTYITQTSPKLTVVVSDSLCADGATGMPHPYTVRVAHDNTTVNGCGGEPSSLLVGEQWIVHEVRGTAITESPPTMVFLRSGRLGGTTSCNRYSGPYRLSGEGLSFGAMTSTKMACVEPRMRQETAFLQALGAVARFEILSDGTLRLLSDDGQAIVARRQ